MHIGLQGGEEERLGERRGEEEREDKVTLEDSVSGSTSLCSSTAEGCYLISTSTTDRWRCEPRLRPLTSLRAEEDLGKLLPPLRLWYFLSSSASRSFSFCSVCSASVRSCRSRSPSWDACRPSWAA